MTDTNFIPLINMGGTATCSPNCGVCTGDCDGDVDCAGDLRCFQRESSTTQVPGCSIGGSGDVGSYDYCYDSSIEFNPDYDKMTVGNNGGVNCNTYCSTGWNNEAAVGSSCVKAVNKGALAGCGATPGGDLTCYCKNPAPCEELEIKCLKVEASLGAAEIELRNREEQVGGLLEEIEQLTGDVDGLKAVIEQRLTDRESLTAMLNYHSAQEREIREMLEEKNKSLEARLGASALPGGRVAAWRPRSEPEAGGPSSGTIAVEAAGEGSRGV
jgi:hypothetical protein